MRARPPGGAAPGLEDAEIEGFIRDGFVRLDRAFPRELADAGRALLWRDSGCDPEDPATWAKPVIRLGLYGQEPFARAANAPRLHRAFDQLVGRGRWLPRMNLGTFPIRFPSAEDPGDAGWHVDPSFGAEDPDFLSWRTNVTAHPFTLDGTDEGRSPVEQAIRLALRQKAP